MPLQQFVCDSVTFIAVLHFILFINIVLFAKVDNNTGQKLLKLKLEVRILQQTMFGFCLSGVFFRIHFMLGLVSPDMKVIILANMNVKLFN